MANPLALASGGANAPDVREASGIGARVLLILCIWLGALACAPVGATEEFASAKQRFRISTLVAGLVHPWGLAFLPDGRLLGAQAVAGNGPRQRAGGGEDAVEIGGGGRRGAGREGCGYTSRC